MIQGILAQEFETITEYKDHLFSVAECRTRLTTNRPPLVFEGKQVRSELEQAFESSIFVDAHV